jgi:hypothetical protein
MSNLTGLIGYEDSDEESNQQQSQATHNNISDHVEENRAEDYDSTAQNNLPAAQLNSKVNNSAEQQIPSGFYENQPPQSAIPDDFYDPAPTAASRSIEFASVSSATEEEFDVEAELFQLQSLAKSLQPKTQPKFADNEAKNGLEVDKAAHSIVSEKAEEEIDLFAQQQNNDANDSDLSSGEERELAAVDEEETQQHWNKLNEFKQKLAALREKRDHGTIPTANKRAKKQ